MYALRPHQTFLLDTVRADADAMARVERILAACQVDPAAVRVFTAEEAPAVAAEIAAWEPADANGVPWQHRRALAFTRIRVDAVDGRPERPADVPEELWGNVAGLRGYIELYHDHHAPESDAKTNMVCWPTRDFGVMNGCPHGCRYCGVGRESKCIVVGANIAEYMDKVVGPVVAARPEQKCFRLIGWGADNPPFEPEYGAVEAYLAKIAEFDDRYGYFHTASDHVDWVEHLPHRDRLIGVWSITPDAVGEIVEPAAPSATARIDAAAKCQSWGVPVRYKFKPMVPLRGWREAYAETIEYIFAKTTPESIGYAVIMWMDVDHLDKCIGLDALDPDFVAAALAEREAMKDVRTGPFPPAVRQEIYEFLTAEIRKYDARVPVYISTESREMWAAMHETLGQNPRKFICGCNPIEVPGPRMAPCAALNSSTYFDPEPAAARTAR